MPHKSLILPFPATVDRVGRTSQQAAHEVTKLTIISFCLSAVIIVLCMGASLGAESCFIALFASALTMIHNAMSFFSRVINTRKEKTMAGVGCQVQRVPLSAHKCMIFFTLLFMIPAWFIVIGWSITDIYFLGLGTWEIWDWGSAASGSRPTGSAAGMIWPFEFMFVWFEIVILSAVSGWSWREGRMILEGSRAERKWYDPLF